MSIVGSEREEEEPSFLDCHNCLSYLLRSRINFCLSASPDDSSLGQTLKQDIQHI
jgi:hypothetical protein